MLRELSWDPALRRVRYEDVLTPALVIYPDFIASNIERTLKLLDGNADRWRVHIKTSKLGSHSAHAGGARRSKFQVRHHTGTAGGLPQRCHRRTSRLPGNGRECASSARHRATSFLRCASPFLPKTTEQLQQWRGSRVGIFLDINPGMNRTGIEQSKLEEIVSLARADRRSRTRIPWLALL